MVVVFARLVERIGAVDQKIGEMFRRRKILKAAGGNFSRG
jgi:hypothetical protein